MKPSFLKLAGTLLRCATSGGVIASGRMVDMSPFLSRDDQIELLSIAHDLNGDLEKLPESVAKLPMIPDFIYVGVIGMMLDPTVESSSAN